MCDLAEPLPATSLVDTALPSPFADLGAMVECRCRIVPQATQIDGSEGALRGQDMRDTPRRDRSVEARLQRMSCSRRGCD
jgi:hypothetical protein